jgi:dUTP pyrophosphatase
MAPQNVAATLRYVRLTQNALPPTRGSTKAAGLDLRSAYDVTIPAFGKGLVETDLAVLLPSGRYGRTAPQSGLAIHRHISVGSGVIDHNYRGNVCVILFNHLITPFHIHGGRG